MLEQFVISICLLTDYNACTHTTQAYYHQRLQQPLTNYYERNKTEAIENVALMAAAVKERKLPLKFGQNLLTIDAEKSMLTVKVPF